MANKVTESTGPAVTFSVRFDRESGVWRVCDFVTGVRLAGDDGRPMGWDRFNDAYDVARRSESVANA